MAKLTDQAGRPHSGLLPYPVPAIVVDNDDPDELGRIKVKFPTLHDEPLSFWIRQVSPNAGKERGFYALPELDDEVLVLFMMGSHDIGVIIGQFWNGEDVPPDEARDGMPGPGQLWKGDWSKDDFEAGSSDDEDNDRRFWKSRSGHLFVFDDTSGEETVQIWDKSHKLALVFDTSNERIILSNSGGDIHIRAKNDLFLEAGNDCKFMVGKNLDTEVGSNSTWTVKQNHKLSANMDIVLDAGKDYKLDASSNITAKAGLNAKIEGSLMFAGKGGQIAKLEGGTAAMVKASTVMLN
ncbi:MAG: hypothetical protein EA397_08225 [Deltaproteobacteria bacterium]|nr:MAG: hypothetical protein EA397_08225 [Deltaproteobacteria bacterium]